MTSWEIKSDRNIQIILIVGGFLSGGALILMSKIAEGADAAFWLGVFLIAIGSSALLSTSKQVIQISPASRLITVSNSGFLRRSVNVISFDEVEDIVIGYVGKKSNHVGFYYLILKLSTGKNHSLFLPGLFKDGSSKEWVESWRKRIREYL